MLPGLLNKCLWFYLPNQNLHNTQIQKYLLFLLIFFFFLVLKFFFKVKRGSQKVVVHGKWKIFFSFREGIQTMKAFNNIIYIQTLNNCFLLHYYNSRKNAHKPKSLTSQVGNCYEIDFDWIHFQKLLL